MKGPSSNWRALTVWQLIGLIAAEVSIVCHYLLDRARNLADPDQTVVIGAFEAASMFLFVFFLMTPILIASLALWLKFVRRHPSFEVERIKRFVGLSAVSIALACLAYLFVAVVLPLPKSTAEMWNGLSNERAFLNYLLFSLPFWGVMPRLLVGCLREPLGVHAT